MATIEESLIQDAAAADESVYAISVGDGFKGMLDSRFDEDWIRVELVAGKSYDIRLQGVGDDTVLDFGNGDDRIDLTAFADVQSGADLFMEQQESKLVIDLSGHRGGTVTLLDYNEAESMDAYFIFIQDDGAAIA